MFFKPNAVTRSALLWGLKTALVIGALILPAAYAENACGAKASLHNPNARNGGIGGTGAPAVVNVQTPDAMAGRPGRWLKAVLEARVPLHCSTTCRLNRWSGVPALAALEPLKAASEGLASLV